MLVLDLMIFSGRCLWMLMIVSVRMLAALFIMFMGSGLSEVIILEIWS